MLAKAYIEALLIDEESADLVWVSWDAGLIDSQQAMISWYILTQGNTLPADYNH